jgi:hypothetical protein
MADVKADLATEVQHLSGILSQFPEVVDRIVTAAVEPKAASIFDARTVQLSADGSPIMLAAYNAARIVFRVKLASTGTALTGPVYIGPLSTLASGTGYEVTNAAEDLHTVSEIYAMYAGADATDPAASISLWAEYALE